MIQQEQQVLQTLVRRQAVDPHGGRHRQWLAEMTQERRSCGALGVRANGILQIEQSDVRRNLESLAHEVALERRRTEPTSEAHESFSTEGQANTEPATGNARQEMLQQDEISARLDVFETGALIGKPQGLVAAAPPELRQQTHTRRTRPPQ